MLTRRFARPLCKSAQKRFATETAKPAATATPAPASAAPLKIHYEEKQTEQDFVAEIHKQFELKEKYVSKYPNVTMDDYKKELDAQLARPVYFDDKYITFLGEAFSMKKDDARMYVSGKIPDVLVPPKNPLFKEDLDVDWDVFKKAYGYTATREKAIGQVERAFKKFRGKIYDLGKTEVEEINWKSYETKIDKNEIEAIKKDAALAYDMYKPPDMELIFRELENALKPSIEKIKDRLYDGLPRLKEATDTLVAESPLLKTDEHGLPLHDFTKDFLDQYFPDIRDEIVEEIETDQWDFEYNEEKRALKLNADILIQTLSQPNRLKDLEKNDAHFMDELSVAASVSEDAMVFQRTYLEVVNLARKNAELENAVNSLRYALIESEQEAAKEGGEQKQEHKEKRELIETYLKKHVKVVSVKKEFPGMKADQGTAEQAPTATPEASAH